MARYKDYDYSQGKFIPIHFDQQILPGTFEYSLDYLIDNEIGLSLFDLRYRNDEIPKAFGTYDPAILLKIILYAYSRGITSSRKIAQCCQENIILSTGIWTDRNLPVDRGPSTQGGDSPCEKEWLLH